MKGSVWVSIVAAVGLGGALGIVLYRKNAPQQAALTQREVATHVLADYLDRQFPGQPALVMSNPFTQQRGKNPQIYAYEEAGLAGLRKGFGSASPIKVVFPALRPEFHQNPSYVYVDPKTTTPLSFLVAEDAFDALAKENPGHQIIVSLI
jgi:hypothetical protein